MLPVALRYRTRSGAFCDAPAYAGETSLLQSIWAIVSTRRIVAQPALAHLNPQEFKPGAQYHSDEDLARLAGDIATTIFHPVGTARMGKSNDPDAVVDSRLRLLDGKGAWVRGLRIVDGSVMPTITSGNTNAPILMMAEKAAQWMKEAHA